MAATNAAALTELVTALGGTPTPGASNAELLAQAVAALGGEAVDGTNAKLISQVATLASGMVSAPTGNKEITANGTDIDVAAYATVSVAVPTPSICVVQFDVDEGTGTVPPQACVVGASYDFPDGTGITPPSEKVFVGWAATSAATEAIEGKFTASATTYYAVYGDA